MSALNVRRVRMLQEYTGAIADHLRVSLEGVKINLYFNFGLPK